MLRSKSLAAAVAAAVMSLGAPYAHTWDEAVDTAEHVVGVYLPWSGQPDFDILCSADGAPFRDAVLIDGMVPRDGDAMSGSLRQIGDPHNSKGSHLQIDEEVSYSEIAEDPRREILGFQMAVIYIGGKHDAVGRLFAVATWGGAPSCQVGYGGQHHALEPLPEASAAYVAPNGFGTGVLIQDRGDQTVVARSFETDLPGGPVVAALNIGNASTAAIAYSGAGQAPTVSTCAPRPQGCSIMAGSVASSHVRADTPVGTSLGSWDHAFTYVALPLGVID